MVRSSNFAATRLLAAIATTFVFLLAPAPVRAADTASYEAELRQIEQQMLELWVDIRNFKPSAPYCKPPYPPLKMTDQAIMSGFQMRVDALNAEYIRVKQSLKDFLADNTGMAGHMMANGATPLEEEWWEASRYQRARARLFKALTEKKKAVEDGKEKNCAPTTPRPRPIESIGEPVQTDPGVTLPSVQVRPVEIPPVPDRFCSQEEKQKTLEAFWKVSWDFYMNYQDARIYAEAINAAIAGGQGNRTVLQNMLKQASANTKLHAKRVDEFQNAYDRVRAMPIVDCGPPPPAKDEKVGFGGTSSYGTDDVGFAINAELDLGWQKLPDFVYLGYENAATEQTFGVEHLKDREAMSAFNADFIAKLGYHRSESGSHRGYADAIHIGVTVNSLDASGARDMLDPLGQDLLLPFVNTPGISLSAGVPEGDTGGANVVSGLRYDFQSDSRTFFAKYSRSWFCDTGAVTGYGGLGYSYMDQQQQLWGEIPGYLSTFRYNTEIDTDVYRVIGGGRVDYPLGNRFSVFANATGMINFVDGSGFDNVDVSGFLNYAESRDISKTDTTFSYMLGIGAEYAIGQDSALYLGYRYVSDDTTPVAVRHDAEPSHIEYDRSEYDLITGGARIRF